MHFGKQLLAKRHEPWASHYLDYQSLKELLEAAPPPSLSQSLSSSSPRKSSFGSSHHHYVVSPPLFVELLHSEVQRVVHFFLRQQGVLSTTLVQELQPRLDRLLQLEQEDLSQHEKEQQDARALQAAYFEAARTLLLLIQFVDLNVTGLRKILKKHDKLTGGHLSRDCFRLNASSGSGGDAGGSGTTPESLRHRIVLRPLLEDGGLEALYVTLRSDLYQVEELRKRIPLPIVHKTSSTLDRWNTWDESEHAGRHSLDENDNEALLSYGIQQSHSERLGVSPASSLFENPTATSPPHVIVLLQIQAARHKLQKSSDFVRMLAASAALLPSTSRDGDDEDADIMTTTLDQDHKRRVSNYLNFCSTFLHMTDYYIVAPTSGMYAERLGDTAALAGLIIGLNSVSALASTILYSWWTTYFSYRSALIFASTCQMMGCLVYASALPCQSLTLVILGRLVGGFGSARSINRRYIADTYPVQYRTAASAGFVTAGALGTSTGPALAALLYWAVAKDSDNLYWQVENAPGWTMAFLWAIYIVCLFVYFAEPPRPHKPTLRKVAPINGESSGYNGEKQALVPKEHANGIAGSSSPAKVSSDPPLWKIVPVTTTFFVYFTLKFILESLLSSTAILTDYYFDWSGRISGWYLAILGLLVLPANWIIAVASQRYDDRDLILATQGFMLLGCLVILEVGSTYTVPHYLFGSILIFVAANALEGPNMSLLSKAIPPRYSRGLFNVGLLATESGTFGRAVGDVILTLSGSRGMSHVLNNAFGMMSVLTAATVALCLGVYDQLEPNEKDD